MIDVDLLINVAKQAGKEILKIYGTDFEIEQKKTDSFDEGESPLTKADTASNDIIIRSLKEKYPDIPILSEENKEVDYQERKDWKRFWLIDPLDGTKEFIKRNGEFTVNIALIDNKKTVFGVVYVPVTDVVYYGNDCGSYKIENGEKIKLPVLNYKREKIIVVASRSHFNDETKEYVESLGKEYELVSKGSSLKLCIVAEGKADIYPRLGPTMEWDTAAAHAIVKFAGKNVYDFKTHRELQYNKESLLNPWFIVK